MLLVLQDLLGCALCVFQFNRPPALLLVHRRVLPSHLTTKHYSSQMGITTVNESRRSQPFLRRSFHVKVT